MKQFYVQLITRSPLAIRSDHAPSGAAAISYIPGTALAGSLAAVHRLLYPTEIENFKRLFLDGQVFYPHLYPAMFKDEGLRNQFSPIYPLPKTAQSCKRHPGFLFPVNEENDAHGVRDSLLDWAVFKLSGNKPDFDSTKAFQDHKYCSCHAVMDHFSGYYRRNRLNSKQMITATVDEHTRLQTHTGIDRVTGTVQDGILYSRKVFEEETLFGGTIKFSGDQHLVSLFLDFIKNAHDSELVRIGTGRTRGMGKVTINIEPDSEKRDHFTHFRERLHLFNDILHQKAGEFQLPDAPDQYFFALTLHTPLILNDEFLRYQRTIDDPILNELLGYEVAGLKRIYQAASMQRITGWQELWGVPRMNEYAIDTGSVFLFSCRLAKETAANEALLKRLFELEEQGIGKRRAEGFGRICISDQFHQETNVR